MLHSCPASRIARLIASALLAAAAAVPAHAGNEANFVLYSHHTESAGETEINVFNDFSRGIKDLPHYNAQLVEIEHAFTDQLVAAVYLETQKTNGDDYKVGGVRAEVRYRPFAYGTFLNPVLYMEYEGLRPDHRYVMEVLGRTDRPEPPGPPRNEHALENKLILGQDIGKGFDVAANIIGEANLDDGHWEYGYAAGLNYTLWRAQRHEEGRSERPRGSADSASGWAVKQLKLGAEVFGGLGDTTLGLTASGRVTQQYAGLNLQAKFDNGFQLTMGGAAGLTGQSEQALFRVMLGVELK